MEENVSAMWTPSVMVELLYQIAFLALGGVFLGVFVGIPTVGMYRESRAHSDHPTVWTTTMGISSVLFWGFGPILVWVAYTAIEVIWR